MSILVVDISNGRTKLALAHGGVLVSAVRVCPTAGLSPQTLKSLTSDWAFAAVVLCSVVPAAARTARDFFSGMVPVSCVTAESDLPVDFCGYAGRATLGADRIANAVAAARLPLCDPLVVIDAGTATTADVVMPAEGEGGKPRFLGGVIAPGPGTMLRTLHSGTALLPEVPRRVPAHAVGQGTIEAMQNGCVRGYRGLLRELLAAMEQECGCCLKPVLTGGDAPLLAELMPELGVPDPLLTLRGIAQCAESMKKC